MGSTPSVPREQRKRLVIIGGGLGGCLVAKHLDTRMHVTLIDTKDWFEYTPSMVDICLQPGEDKLAQRHTTFSIAHSEYVQDGDVVVGKVDSISADAKEVHLADGRSFKCDYLLLASGSTNRPPWKAAPEVLTRKQRVNELFAANQDIAKAERILVIGGGAVGVEVAAEIISRHPKKQLTVVHNFPTLLEREPDAGLGRDAEAFFRARNVNLVLNERAEPQGDEKERKEGPPYRYRTSEKGTIIEVDLVLPCVGMRPNSQYMLPHLKQHVDAKGFIVVNDKLQLAGDEFAHCFSIGDVNNAPVEKTAKLAKHQALFVIKQLRAALKGQQLQSMPAGNPPGTIISLGPDGALMDFGYIKAHGWKNQGSALGSVTKVGVAHATLHSLKTSKRESVKVDKPEPIEENKQPVPA